MSCTKLLFLAIVFLSMNKLNSQVGNQKDPPWLVDLAQLNLEVTKVEVISSISSKVAGLKRIISAEPGEKLVAVHFKGNLNHTCRLSIAGSDFTAIYNMNSDLIKFANSAAVTMEVVNWWFPDERVSFTFKKGELNIRAAFILPKDVSNFLIGYRTLVKGEAILPK